MTGAVHHATLLDALDDNESIPHHVQDAIRHQHPAPVRI
jgi:hypothetical protein